MFLFRPVGLEELQLIYNVELKAFPPRLPEQPIFYPVLNREYARQIARDWNTRSGALAGYVTQFEIDDLYASQFEPKIVGSPMHQELWVPSERLTEFNSYIKSQILIIDAFFGYHFTGAKANSSMLKNLSAIDQFILLTTLTEEQLCFEIQAHHNIIFLHFPFWQQFYFTNIPIELKNITLAKIKSISHSLHREIPLGLSEFS